MVRGSHMLLLGLMVVITCSISVLADWENVVKNNSNSVVMILTNDSLLTAKMDLDDTDIREE